MKRIVLVSCVKKKQKCPCLARDMYTSWFFRAMREYAEREGDSGWFILSAKHKLLSPEKKIETYDESLNDYSADKRKAWSREVIESLAGQFTPGEHGFIILAGDKYCDPLESMLRDHGFQTLRPLKGLPRGGPSRLKFLNEQKKADID